VLEIPARYERGCRGDSVTCRKIPAEGVLMARRTASVSPAYVLDIDDDDWRVVIPIYGKLNPVLHRVSFETRAEAEEWLSGTDGQMMVAQLQAGLSSTRSNASSLENAPKGDGNTAR